MNEVLQRDLLTILDFLHGASAVGGRRTFASYVTSEVSRVIPATLTAYAELDLVKRSVQWVMDRADTRLPDVPRVLAAHIDDDPFIVYRKRTGDPDAVRLSDLTTPRVFQQTGLYREFYRPLHLRHSLTCALRLDPGHLAAIALYRHDADFSERERRCLDVLRPHLVHLHRNAEAMSRARRELTLVTRGVEALNQAFVIAGREGRIRRATRSAERWLTAYFERPPGPDRLPGRVWEWMRCQDGRRAGRDEPWPSPRQLVVEREGRRLTVRMVAEPPDSILLLEEAATRLAPPVLAGLGLSSREAEVLVHVADGKTNPAIGEALHISPRTVQTHLERIYRKLGVATRTAAAARALEALRERSGAA